MITAYATVENAVAAFRRGAHDYLMKPVIFDELLAKIDRLIGYRRLLLENQALRRQLHARGDLDALVGPGPAMQAVKTLIRKVGPTRSNVLITGESGTGKELVARALHALGPAPDDVFLAINCAAIPHDLLENQLFGHVRGAFTGADRDHAGLFVAAGGGTVFLDEIGELSRSTQAKLLRAIENKEVLPVGATRPGRRFGPGWSRRPTRTWRPRSPPDRFRADLYYRLNVVTIHLPPLRDRREDIPELVAALLARHARRLGKRVDGVDNATIRGLMAAPWKGNVRELDNALERAVILGEGPILTPDDFPARPDRRERRRQPGRRPPRGRARLRAPAHPARPPRVRRRQARGRPPARAGPVVALPQARRAWCTSGRHRTVGVKVRPSRAESRVVSLSTLADFPTRFPVEAGRPLKDDDSRALPDDRTRATDSRF